MLPCLGEGGHDLDINLGPKVGWGKAREEGHGTRGVVSH